MFDFFKLPPELRDRIYLFCTQDINITKRALTTKGTDSCGMTLQYGPLTNLLTLSHEFKTEYEECLHEHQTLFFEHADVGRLAKYVRPEVFRYRNIDSMLMVVGNCPHTEAHEQCSMAATLKEAYEKHESALAMFRGLASVKITIRLCWSSQSPPTSFAYVRTPCTMPHLHRLTHLPKLKYIEVCPSRANDMASKARGAPMYSVHEEPIAI